MLNRFTLLAGLGATATAETIHSVIVLTRHGDRTAKWFGSTNMTNLGAQQVYMAGDYYRQRYLSNTSDLQIAGISQDQAIFSQLWTSAPEETVLFQTATNFLQGLYPPLGSSPAASQQLVNGTEVDDPLNGYQFVLVNGVSAKEPDTIWIKGDEQCPAWTSASKTYRDSPEYQSTLSANAPFYSSLEPLLQPFMGAGNVSYKNAYDVFDITNVEAVHNSTFADQIPEGALDTARYLANTWEYNMNYNATLDTRSIGGKAFAGRILSQMDAIVKSSAKKNKFNLMAGSYDTFMAFFGMTNATAASDDFYGLPNYASSMSFELFTEADNAAFPQNVNDDLKVRWFFKNGTGENVTGYPLFGQEQQALSYGDFVSRLNRFAITSVGQWCGVCGSAVDFCVAANQSASAATGDADTGSTAGHGLSNAAAGGIGAAVTLAVIGVLGALAWLLMRKRAPKGVAGQRAAIESEKKASGSETDSV